MIRFLNRQWQVQQLSSQSFQLSEVGGARVLRCNPQALLEVEKTAAGGEVEHVISNGPDLFLRVQVLAQGAQ